ncbi:hypothetical protein E5161_08040 [Cohnella pontilimi]|uniref:Cadherin-like beta-sandwich-like domain-containing protein n=1 Tax=Cohnella pontilimi TaxID=2564100 RepID=A0A4U0FH96_9BACL|nr:cadherin-like beta sandwich domain-containing protein [Cohnella pontilimi]TJY42782.1 hypothetical protein E5161_08040 [Cohnella pontilimi]
MGVRKSGASYLLKFLKIVQTLVTTGVVGIAAIFAPEPSAAAAGDIVVTSRIDLPDSNPSDGICSTAVGCTLRAAIQTANNRSGEDTIILPPGTYLLALSGIGEEASAAGDLDILESVNIIGSNGNPDSPASATVIDAGGIDRVFEINPEPWDKIINASFKALTIQNGNDMETFDNAGGGGIYYEATDGKNSPAGHLTIYNCVITNNRTTNVFGIGGGIFLGNYDNRVDALAMIEKSVITGNYTTQWYGGGIGNAGMPLEIRDSTISNNQARSSGSRSSPGGGIYAHGSKGKLTIQRTTISNNSAQGDSRGGGIYVVDQPVTIENTTISGNVAGSDGGGIWWNSPSNNLMIANATITKNQALTGGGVTEGGAAGMVTLRNSIVYGNTAIATNPDVQGTFDTATYNIVGNTAGATGIYNDVNGNKVGVDPLLSILGNWGGPTQTHKLLPGSPAIEAGDNIAAPVGRDQRGNLRILDSADSDSVARVDIGAVEAHPTVSDISNQGGVAGTLVLVPFYVGDASAGVNISTTSSNQAVIPDNKITIVNGNTYNPVLQIIGASGGTATITVTVTAGGDTASDSFTITLAGSSNANLSGLTISQGLLSPAFSSGTTSYTASVGYEVNSITVTPIAEDINVSIKVKDVTTSSGSPASIPLSVGPNPIDVLVTAQDGTTQKTYTVIVTRAASTNADLSNLTLSAGTLSPVFASGTTSYTASVANSVGTIAITPTVADSTASIKVNGNATASGTAVTVPLSVGSNTITVLVTAQNGTTQKTYTVTVTRAPSTNADLSTLTISHGVLNPVFAPGTLNYSVSIDSDLRNINITPTAADSTAAIKVNGIAATSGSAVTVALKRGTNIITVLVTAQDGTTQKTYTVTVNRSTTF